MTTRKRLIGQKFYAQEQKVEGIVVAAKCCRSHSTCPFRKCVGYTLNILVINSPIKELIFELAGFKYCGWISRLPEWTNEDVDTKTRDESIKTKRQNRVRTTTVKKVRPTRRS
jgi:hypothetical protein